MSRKDWIACENCATPVPAGLLVEAERYGVRQNRCMTCDGALERLDACGVAQLDAERFARAGRAIQTELHVQADRPDTINPIDMLVRTYLNRGPTR